MELQLAIPAHRKIARENSLRISEGLKRALAKDFKLGLSSFKAGFGFSFTSSLGRASIRIEYDELFQLKLTLLDGPFESLSFPLDSSSTPKQLKEKLIKILPAGFFTPKETQNIETVPISQRAKRAFKLKKNAG